MSVFFNSGEIGLGLLHLQELLGFLRTGCLIRTEQRGLYNVFGDGMIGKVNDDGSGGIGSSDCGCVGWAEVVAVVLAL